MLRMKEASSHGRTAAAHDAIGQFHRRYHAGHLKRKINTALGVLPHLGCGIRIASIHGEGRAELPRGVELLVIQIDGNDLACTRRDRTEQRAHANATQTDHGRRLTRLHSRGVHHSADAGQHRAAK